MIAAIIRIVMTAAIIMIVNTTDAKNNNQQLASIRKQAFLHTSTIFNIITVPQNVECQDRMRRDVWGARAVAGGSASARAGDDISSSLYTLNIALCNVMLWQLHLAIWNWRQCYPYSVPRWLIWIWQNALIGDNLEYNVYSILCMLVYFPPILSPDSASVNCKYHL